MSSPRILMSAAAALLAAGAASAQAPRIPTDAKGFRIQQAMMASQAAESAAVVHHQAARPARVVVESPAAAQQVQIAMTVPSGPAPAAVAVRGPDGELRSFPVEGGSAGLANRVIVRRGQAVTVRVTPQGARVDRQ